MIQGLIAKKLIDVVLKKVMQKQAMKKLHKYVNEDNSLDIKVREHTKEIKSLKKDSHPPIFTTKNLDKIYKRLDKLEKNK